MCLITSRNVKQTSTSTKTAEPSTNCNEPLRICFLPAKARAGRRGKDRTPEGDRSPSSFPEASLLCRPNRVMGCSGSPLWLTRHPWRGVQPGGQCMSRGWSRDEYRVCCSGPWFESVCPHPASFCMERSTHPNPYLHKGSLFLPCLLPLSTLSVKCSPTWKNNPPGSCKMCPHTSFLFSLGTWIKDEFHWSITHGKVSPPVFSRHLQKAHPLKETHTKPRLFLPRRTRRQGTKKADTPVKVSVSDEAPGRHLQQLALSGCQPHSPEWGHTPKNKMSVMHHTYYRGQKPKKRRRGGRKINNRLTVWWQNFAKELISTSAKPLENTTLAFLTTPGFSDAREELKAPRNKLSDQSPCDTEYAQGTERGGEAGSDLNLPKTPSEIDCSCAHCYTAGETQR